MMLSLDTAYRSFGGEVEASSTPTICRLPDSRRHQLSAIALAKTWMGYRDRRIHVLLRRDGWRANIKRVRRLVVFTPVRLEGHSNSHCCFSSRSWSGSLIDNQLVVAGPFTCVSTKSV